MKREEISQSFIILRWKVQKREGKRTQMMGMKVKKNGKSFLHKIL